jgi:fermentation-respiration switch protein FrsA (DUF1100 family)
MTFLLRALAAPAFFLAALATPAAGGPVRDRIYPAPTAPLSLAALPADAQLIGVRTADGLALAGIAVPARDGMPTLLAFHGNGSSAADMVAWFAPLIAKGYGMIAAEYRGYSANPGKPDEAGLTADALAFYADAKARAGAGPLWVVGHSLGAGVAMRLAGREHFDALVTIGAFTRLRAMAPAIARAFVPDAYDNLAALQKLDEPWFLIHGTSDGTVPWQQGEKLHTAAGTAGKSGASFVILGADHKPGPEFLAPIAATIAASVKSGSYSAAALPATVRLIPFGQDKPVKP